MPMPLAAIPAESDEAREQSEAKKAEGNAAFASGDCDKAVQLYTEAIKLDGRNSACVPAAARGAEARGAWLTPPPLAAARTRTGACAC